MNRQEFLDDLETQIYYLQDIFEAIQNHEEGNCDAICCIDLDRYFNKWLNGYFELED